jgi:hypothetical protein
MKRSIFLLALISTLVACANKMPKSADKDTTQKVGEAVVAPLNDLNLVKAEIPEVLLQAAAAPYAVPVELSCQKLSALIVDLDEYLGLDLDAPKAASGPSLLERGAEQAENAGVSMIRSTTQSIIPFRGWVRKLSGAERYSKKVSAAITAGSVRRAFLKGMRTAQGCEAVPQAVPAR